MAAVGFFQAATCSANQGFVAAAVSALPPTGWGLPAGSSIIQGSEHGRRRQRG